MSKRQNRRHEFPAAARLPIFLALPILLALGMAPAKGVNLPHVADNTALKATTAASAGSNRVMRDGFAAPGDGGQAVYDWSASNCAVADDGAQVQPSSTGCWIADFASTRPNPIIWGAKGDGSTIDTTKVQAAINAVAGKRELFVGGKLYRVGALTLPNGTKIIGDSKAVGVYASDCQTGFKAATANIDLLTWSGTVKIHDVCIWMISTNAGAAIKMTPANPLYPSGSVVDAVTIIGSCDSIDVSTGAFGQTVLIQNSVITRLARNTSCAGIRIGRNTINGGTSIHASNNYINCFADANDPSPLNYADGWVIEDSGGSHLTNNEQFACRYGTRIWPSTAQWVQYNVYTGHLFADTNTAGGLYIKPQTDSSLVINERFVGAWTSNTAGVTGSTKTQVFVDGSVVRVEGLQFVGSQFLGTVGSTLLKVSNATDVQVSASTLCVSGGASTAPLVYLNPAVRGFTFTDNLIGACNAVPNGTFGTGIQIDTGADRLIISGNHFVGAAAVNFPISWTPVGNESAVIHSNLGIDDTKRSVASALTINVGFGNFANVTGTNMVRSVVPSWSNRGPITLMPTGPWQLQQGTGNICSPTSTAIVNVPIIGLFSGGNGCWYFK